MPAFAGGSTPLVMERPSPVYRGVWIRAGAAVGAASPMPGAPPRAGDPEDDRTARYR